MVKKLFLLLVMLMSVPAFGSLALLSSSDVVIAVDADGLVSQSSYPGGEAPLYALDQNSGTKYLNFAGPSTGFIVTPAGATTVRSFRLTTANDAEGRDPASWALWGTNDAITSADNSTGLAENWTLVGSGSVALPDARFTVGPVVTFSNSTAYNSYRMLYPTLKGGAGELMQIADVAYYTTPSGSGSSVLSASDPILAIHGGAQDSRYPGNESPANLVDGSTNKYLNFGRLNSGFIVTPAMGTSIVDSFQITTANDSAERDPASWELYGTLDAILSGDNTEGTAETWTLIANGTIALPDDRNTLGPLVEFSNSTAYASYKILFPTLKNADSANSMQIAEIQLYGIPEPATICLLGMGGLALIRRRLS
ncbi:MAG TPA: PEP-CTERM sorting domain-containing protein [Sedimentisphaerales bacterium]|nr:PEP-CTERM sorting domain-containing protein [Sedimentisphaerales bacterium]